jgi:hypothetical protein
MSRTLRSRAVPVILPAQSEVTVVRKYVYGVNLVGWVHVCAANETLAREVVTSALGSPSSADIRLANEASFVEGRCATITDVTFSIGECPARLASVDAVPQGVEIKQIEPIAPVEPLHARRRRNRRRTDVNLVVLKPDNPPRISDEVVRRST